MNTRNQRSTTSSGPVDFFSAMPQCSTDNLKRTITSLSVLCSLYLPVNAKAESLYGLVLLGNSQQATESQPYGDNIAADPDFPAEFDSGDGGLVAIGVGYSLHQNVRIEGRLGFRRGKFNDTKFGTGERAGEEYTLNGSIEALTLNVDGFYDIPTASAFTPYLKAGIGLSNNEYSAKLGGAGVSAFDPFDGATDGFYDNYPDQSATNFSWNAGIGVSVALSDKAIIFGEYQYLSLGDVETGQDDFTDGFQIESAATSEVSLGVRLSF